MTLTEIALFFYIIVFILDALILFKCMVNINMCNLMKIDDLNGWVIACAISVVPLFNIIVLGIFIISTCQEYLQSHHVLSKKQK